MKISAVAIKSWPIFHGMTESDIEEILKICEIVDYKAGDQIIKENGLPVAMYILIEGECKVTVSQSGKEILVATIGPTEIFGEVGFVDDYPRTATVTATKPSKVLLLRKSKFEELVERNTKLGFKLMKNIAYVIAKRLRKVDEKLKQLPMYT